LDRMHDAAYLTRKRHARGNAEAVIPNIVINPGLSHFNPNFTSANVRRFCNDSLHGKHSVGLVVVQGASAVKPMSSFAVEAIVQAYHLVIKRAGDDNDFESGPWFGDI